MEERLTSTPPPDGAAPLSLTLPVVEAPPVRVAKVKDIPISVSVAGDWTVKVADGELPPPGGGLLTTTG